MLRVFVLNIEEDMIVLRHFKEERKFGIIGYINFYLAQYQSISSTIGFVIKTFWEKVYRNSITKNFYNTTIGLGFLVDQPSEETYVLFFSIFEFQNKTDKAIPKINGHLNSTKYMDMTKSFVSIKEVFLQSKIKYYSCNPPCKVL